MYPYVVLVLRKIVPARSGLKLADSIRFAIYSPLPLQLFPFKSAITKRHVVTLKTVANEEFITAVKKFVWGYVSTTQLSLPTCNLENCWNIFICVPVTSATRRNWIEKMGVNRVCGGSTLRRRGTTAECSARLTVRRRCKKTQVHYHGRLRAPTTPLPRGYVVAELLCRHCVTMIQDVC